MLPLRCRCAEHAVRGNTVTKQNRSAMGASIRCADGGELKPGRLGRISFSPTEARMRVENLQPTTKQQRQANDIDPMHDPYRPTVAVNLHFSIMRVHRVANNLFRVCVHNIENPLAVPISDRHIARIGRNSWTVVPPSGVAWMLNVPPSRSMRSLAPIRPQCP